MKTEKIIGAVLFGLLIFSQLSLLAQAGPPPGPGGSGAIDGGVFALVVGVAAYGYKKLSERKKRVE